MCICYSTACFISVINPLGDQYMLIYSYLLSPDYLKGKSQDENFSLNEYLQWGKYIKEQIDSILSQKDVECYVLIRDDGSKDNTLQLLRTYDSNDRIRIITGKNCGYIRSFSILVEEASK